VLDSVIQMKSIQNTHLKLIRARQPYKKPLIDKKFAYQYWHRQGIP